MKKREDLIEVWLDTERRVINGEYPHNLTYRGSSSKGSAFFSNRNKYDTKISVENRDCIDVANDLVKTGKTCMLNMASYKHPGGGVKKGSMAQEEELARRSNLMWGLPIDAYPMKMTTVIYTNDVTFFKDSNYQIMPSFECDVITIAAINLNGLNMPEDYEELMYDKICTMIFQAHMANCDNLVLSAFGCGVFKNDPTYVATLFKKALEEYPGLFKNVSFAILNDRNSVGSNYEIFHNIMK
jgi:uncharacterized protein (TIGR02452 family)